MSATAPPKAAASYEVSSTASPFELLDMDNKAGTNVLYTNTFNVHDISFSLQASLHCEGGGTVTVSETTSGLMCVDRPGIRRQYRCRFTKTFAINRTDGTVIIDGESHMPFSDVTSKVSEAMYLNMRKAPPISAERFAALQPLFAKKPILGFASICSLPAYHGSLTVCPSNVTTARYDLFVKAACGRSHGSVQMEWLFYNLNHVLHVGIEDAAISKKALTYMTENQKKIQSDRKKSKKEPLSGAREMWSACILTFMTFRKERMNMERYLESNEEARLLAAVNASATGVKSPAAADEEEKPSAAAAARRHPTLEDRLKKPDAPTGFLAARRSKLSFEEKEALYKKGNYRDSELGKEIEAERERRSLLKMTGDDKKKEKAKAKGDGDADAADEDDLKGWSDEDADDDGKGKKKKGGKGKQPAKKKAKPSEDIEAKWEPTPQQFDAMLACNRKHFLCVESKGRPMPVRVMERVETRRREMMEGEPSSWVSKLAPFGWNSDGTYTSNTKTQDNMLKGSKDWMRNKAGDVLPKQCILYDGETVSHYTSETAMKTALTERSSVALAQLNNKSAGATFLPVGKIQSELLARYDTRCFHLDPVTYEPKEIQVPDKLLNARTKAMAGFAEKFGEPDADATATADKEPASADTATAAAASAPEPPADAIDASLAASEAADAAAAMVDSKSAVPAAADAKAALDAKSDAKTAAAVGGKKPKPKSKSAEAIKRMCALKNKYGDNEPTRLLFYLFDTTGRVQKFETHAELCRYVINLYSRSEFATNYNPLTGLMNRPPPKPLPPPPPAAAAKSPEAKASKKPSKAAAVKPTKAGDKRKREPSPNADSRGSSDGAETDAESIDSLDENTIESEEENEVSDDEDVDLSQSMSDDEATATRKREILDTYKFDVAVTYPSDAAHLTEEECIELNVRVVNAVMSDEFVKDPHAYVEFRSDFLEDDGRVADKVFVTELTAVANRMQPQVNAALEARAERMVETRDKRMRAAAAAKQRALLESESDDEESDEVVHTDSEDVLGKLDAKLEDRRDHKKQHKAPPVKSNSRRRIINDDSSEATAAKAQSAAAAPLTERKRAFSPLRENKKRVHQVVNYDDSMVVVGSLSPASRQFVLNIHDLFIVVRKNPSITFKVMRMDSAALAVVEANMKYVTGTQVSKLSLAQAQVHFIFDEAKKPSEIKNPSMKGAMAEMARTMPSIHAALDSAIAVDSESISHRKLLMRQEIVWLMPRFTPDVGLGERPKNERLVEIPDKQIAPTVASELPIGYTALVSGNDAYIKLRAALDAELATGIKHSILEAQMRVAVICLRVYMKLLQCTNEFVISSEYALVYNCKPKDVNHLWSMIRGALVQLRGWRQEVDTFVRSQTEIQFAARRELNIKILPADFGSNPLHTGLWTSVLLKYTELDHIKLTGVRVAEEKSKSSDWTERMLDAERGVSAELQKFIGDRAVSKFIGDACMCQICKENMVVLKVVPNCGHALCVACVESTKRHAGEDGPLCPMCRGPLIAEGRVEPTKYTDLSNALADLMGKDVTQESDPVLQMQLGDYKKLKEQHWNIIERLMSEMDNRLEKQVIKTPFTGPISQARDVLGHLLCEKADIRRYDVSIDPSLPGYVVRRL